MEPTSVVPKMGTVAGFDAEPVGASNGVFKWKVGGVGSRNGSDREVAGRRGL